MSIIVSAISVFNSLFRTVLYRLEMSLVVNVIAIFSILNFVALLWLIIIAWNLYHRHMAEIRAFEERRERYIQMGRNVISSIWPVVLLYLASKSSPHESAKTGRRDIIPPSNLDFVAIVNECIQRHIAPQSGARESSPEETPTSDNEPTSQDES